MTMILYRILATLWTALAMVGLFTVSGFPAPLSTQVVSALASSVAVNMYVEFYRRRQQRKKDG